MRPDLPGGLALNAVGAFGVLVRQADATRSRASSPIKTALSAHSPQAAPGGSTAEFSPQKGAELREI